MKAIFTTLIFFSFLFLFGQEEKGGITNYWLDSKGNEIEYQKLKKTHHNLIRAELNSKYGLLDSQGKEIMPFIYDEISGCYNEVMIGKLNGVYELINSSGKKITDLQFEYVGRAMKTDTLFTKGIDSFHENGAIVVSVDGKKGVFTSSGELLPIQYDRITIFNNWLITKNNNQYQLFKFNWASKAITSNLYDFIYVVNDGKVLARFQNKAGVIDVESEEFIVDKSMEEEIVFLENIQTKKYDKEKVINSEYTGGLSSLRQFVASRIEYPELAIDNGTQGRVIVRFIVDIDGTPNNFSIQTPILGDGLENEVIRILKRTKNWKPAILDEKPVRTYYRFPVVFNTN